MDLNRFLKRIFAIFFVTGIGVTVKESSYVEYEIKPMKGWEKLVNPNLGMVEAKCPHCYVVLKKFPGRKTKCRACGRYMYIRTRPYDGKKIIILDEEKELVELDNAKKYGQYEEFLADKKRKEEEQCRFEGKRKELKKIRKSEFVKDSAVQWNIYNEDRLKSARNRDWKDYGHITGKMAFQLYKEGKYDSALNLWLEEAYFRLCRPIENEGFSSREMILFSPRVLFLKFFMDCMVAANFTIMDIEKQFFQIDFINLDFPISKKEAWPFIKKGVMEWKKLGHCFFKR